MAYEPYNWTTASYVNPGNMNHLEQGVAGASTTAEKAASDITKTNEDLTDLSGVVTTLNSKLTKSVTWSKSVTVEPYQYSLGGYKQVAEISSFDGYNADIFSRAIAIIPTSCCYETNSLVLGVASVFGESHIVINGSNAGNYYIKITVLYL